MRTLCIIKPDSVEMNVIGEICEQIERSGLKVCAMKMIRLSKQRAAEFYEEHSGKDFFPRLIDFMCSGPCVVMALSAEGDAVSLLRGIMGSTSFEKAQVNTIRRRFATELPKTAVHGSDSEEHAKREIAFFFNEDEILR